MSPFREPAETTRLAPNPLSEKERHQRRLVRSVSFVSLAFIASIALPMYNCSSQPSTRADYHEGYRDGMNHAIEELGKK